ncbi:MAG: hypothetical protein ACM31C_01545 [Acidobacteriota bacterium]
MKHLAFATLLALAASAGCSKANDLPELQEDAIHIEKYYAPKLDNLEARLHDVLAQSGRVPKNLPGSDEATRALVDARDKLVELRNLGKTIEKQAPMLANQGKLAELEKTVEDEEKRYEDGVHYVHENLMEVESWLTNAIRATEATQTGAPAAGSGSAAPMNPADVPATAVP